MRDIPDFPKPGILFRDLTPLMGDGAALQQTVELLAERLAPHRPDVIVAIESRGFIFGAPVAAALGIGFAPVRKPGKLPFRTRAAATSSSTAPTRWRCTPTPWSTGARVVIVDDLLATGGTAAATLELVARARRRGRRRWRSSSSSGCCAGASACRARRSSR